MKKYCTLGVLAAITGFALTSAAHAAPIMFATFDEPAASKGVTFANNTTFGIISASTTINFQFTSPTGLPTIDHAATLTFSGGILSPATTFGSFADEFVAGDLSVIEIGTGKNLLTMSYTGDLTGKIGGQNADLAGDQGTANIVTFSSDFLSFANTGNSFNLGLATLFPSLSIGPGGFLNSFIANIDGEFTADNVSGGAPGTPEPASLSILSLGAAALLTRRRNA